MARRFRNMSPFARAWWGIFLTTLAAVVVDATVLFIGSDAFVARSDIPGAMISALGFMALIVVPAGATGAVVCAAIVRLRPLKHTLPMFFLLVAVAGFLIVPAAVLLFPVPIVVIPVTIVSAQLAASGVALSVRKDPTLVAIERPGVCPACGYSLAGLDRTTSPVCPECGGAIV